MEFASTLMRLPSSSPEGSVAGARIANSKTLKVQVSSFLLRSEWPWKPWVKHPSSIARCGTLPDRRDSVQ